MAAIISNLESVSTNLTEVEFLELLGGYARDKELTSIQAWRKFRGSHSQTILPGKNGAERETVFMNLFDRYRKYPAAYTMDFRQAKIKAYKTDLTEAMLTCNIIEPDIEDWMKAIQGFQQYDPGVSSALELLAEYDERLSNELRDAAGRLWPRLFTKPNDDEDSQPVSGEVGATEPGISGADGG